MKKVFTLFALLLTIVIGAKADETVLYELGSDGTFTTGSDAKSYNNVTEGEEVKIHTNQDKVKGLKFGNSYKTDPANYVLLEPEGGFKAGDVITIAGVFNNSSDDKQAAIAIYSSDGATKLFQTANFINGRTVADDPVAEEFTLESDVTKLYFGRAGNTSTFITTFKITRTESATTAPTITTDLSATAGVTVGIAEDFSIVATGATSYQWYKDNVAIEGATSATYSYTAEAAGTVNLKCVASNSIGDTPSTVCAVTATAPASAPEITTDLDAEYSVQKGKSITLSIVAEGASSYQWYLDNVAIEGATSDSYEYTANNEVGQAVAIYCVASNAAGDTGSQIATVTTTGSDKCQLISVKFSTGVYGAITEPTPAKEDDPTTAEDESAPAQNGKVEVPYTAGTLYPGIVSTSVQVSEDAVFYATDDAIVVNAQDGVTSATYDLEFVAVTPLEVITDVATTDFTEVPSWVFNKYGYDDSKGLKFAKAVNEESNMRISKGNTRQYYFIGAAKNITFTPKGTIRKVNVYVNGTKVISDTKNDGLGAIELDENGNNIVIVESNQTGGDGGFASYAIEASATENIAFSGVTTYVTKHALDFSQVTDLSAYAVTQIKTTSVATEKVGEVPAGTPLLIKATGAVNVDVPVIESAEAITNLLLASDGNVAGDGSTIFAYSKNDLKFKKVASTVTIPAGKAYLQIANAGQSLDIDFEGEATGVNGVAEAKAEVAPVKVIKNGQLFIGNYNVAGQQVK